LIAAELAGFPIPPSDGNSRFFISQAAKSVAKTAATGAKPARILVVADGGIYDKHMDRFGLVRVGVGIPRVCVAAVEANARGILELLHRAADEGCDVVAFPELCLTGYTCGDLFQQRTLQEEAVAELHRLANAAPVGLPLIVVGLPLAVAGRLFNVAAVIGNGRVSGLVPKQHIPNYKEFYERRWFVPARGDEPKEVSMPSGDVPFGTDLAFAAEDWPELVVGVELCEDLWVPTPPSCLQALAGATLLINLSASNESTGKTEYRRDLVVNQSGRCIAGYTYAAAGVTESTTDLVFGGHGMIAENGVLLAEAARFERKPNLLVADVDIERLATDRLRMSTFAELGRPELRRVGFRVGATRRSGKLRRFVPAHPFVPSDPNRLAERCEEIFQIQMAGLAQRLESVNPTTIQIGVSGGLDSTLALLVSVRTVDLLAWDRRRICGLTMPGFGTSRRTRTNAGRLMELLGVSASTIDIREMCLQAFAKLDHHPFGIDPKGMSVEAFQSRLAELAQDERTDLVFENVQARVRTLLLMSRGFVVSTGDLSELALGWCTYNADHMGMYNPNAGIPKTLVRFLVRWVADHEFTEPARNVLHSIVETEISPELLPIPTTGAIQSTEAAIGPYELHDFFLYHMVRFGYRPRKILYLAGQAQFERSYSCGELRHWLEVFYRRFFANQFKRSCLPDGPKVGSISLSPRGDWRMPSDADAATWLAELASVPPDGHCAGVATV
jgi:NAD+ synthase (glutamine-hydrolysing)